MFGTFQTALGFLTVVRVQAGSAREISELGKSAWAFPLVGALIGAALVGTYMGLSSVFPVGPTAVVTVALWILLTGGLHIDGWTDCWDALSATVPPERRYEILKDSRLGTFGALALFLLLALKISVLSGGLSPVALFAAPVIGRGLMVWVAHGTHTPATGMAAGFLSSLTSRSAYIAALIGLAFALLAGVLGLAAFGLAYVVSICFRRFCLSRLGMFNGDAMGAVCEISETLVLLVCCTTW